MINMLLRRILDSIGSVSIGSVLTTIAADASSILSTVNSAVFGNSKLNDDLDDLLEYEQSSQQTMPSAAAGVLTTTSGAGLYAKGAWVQITAGLASKSAIKAIVIDNISDVDEFEIDLGTGAPAAEVVKGTFKFAGIAIGGQARIEDISMAVIPINTRIACKIGCNDGVARTVRVSIEFISIV